MANADEPGIVLRRPTESVDAARATVEQRARQLMVSQDLGRLLDRVALPNRTQVERDALAVEGDGEVFLVQMEMPRAGHPQRLAQLLFRRDAAAFPGKPPAANQRPRSRVECCTGRVRNL